MIPTLVFIMGATNSGKSTLISELSKVDAFDDRTGNPCYKAVEVGKLLRAKYGPDYFKGEAAPTHTATEAWDMMINGIMEHTGTCEVVLIDGQPRDLEQAQAIIKLPHKKVFFNLWSSHPVRHARAVARDGGDPQKLQLSLKRLQGDLPKLYDVLSFLESHGEIVTTVDTEEEGSFVFYCHTIVTHVRNGERP